MAGSTRQFLASCSRDKTVIVWDVTNETVLAKFVRGLLVPFSPRAS